MNEHQFEIDGGVVQVRCTTRADGSFALDESAADLAQRRSRVLGERPVLGQQGARRWVALRQVHGAAVVDAAVVAPAADRVATMVPEADAAVSFDETAAVSVLTADCAPVVLVGSTGVAVVHAGWRGAVAGVVEAAAERLRCGGAVPVATLLGPCIQPPVYEFGLADLEPIVEAFGPEIVGVTVDGSDALDLTRVVQIACDRAGWPIPDRPECTSAAGYFSHRQRADKGRQTTVAWIERGAT